ncbi:hypothetical protein ACFLS9_06000 [Bacteroidota bacterium]
MSKKLFLYSVLLLFISASLIHSQKTTFIQYVGGYKNWNDIYDGNISQFSNQLFINYTLQRYTQFKLAGGLASSDVLDSKLDGLSDIQFSLNHKLRKLNTSLEFGVNIPSGEESLSTAEFASAILLSQDIFNMKYPLLGQGTNVFFGATWANNLSDNVVFGLGFSYQIRGEYEPLSNVDLKYKPSDEILLTTGIDFRINKSSTLSGDIIGIFFGKDEVNGEEIFSTGSRYVFNLKYRQYLSKNILRFFIRYRHSEVDKVEVLEEVISNKINPNHLMLSATFFHHISDIFSLTYLAEGHFFEETVAPFSGYNLFGFGISFSVQVSSILSIPLQVKYLTGSSEGQSISGYDISAGLNLTF